MNDNELDEMLDQWKAPLLRDSLRDSLRQNLRAGLAARPEAAKRPSLWRRTMDALRGMHIGRLAAGTMGVAAILFTLIQVSPQTVRMASPGYRIPYYVEYTFQRFGSDGSPWHLSLVTSFPYGGSQIVMSVTEPGRTVLRKLQRVASSIQMQFILAMPSLVLPKEPLMAEPAWFAGFVASGCSSGKTVVGQETIAGYQTTVVESASPGRRTRIWMAPALSCLDLKLTDEVQEPDGTYRLRLHKEAFKVTIVP